MSHQCAYPIKLTMYILTWYCSCVRLQQAYRGDHAKKTQHFWKNCSNFFCALKESLASLGSPLNQLAPSSNSYIPHFLFADDLSKKETHLRYLRAQIISVLQHKRCDQKVKTLLITATGNCIVLFSH
jgi:hypothetical protein